MPAITHAALGELTVDPTNGVRWERTVKLANRDILVDLTIEDETHATPKILDRCAKFVTCLADFEALARAHLRQTYDQDPDAAVGLYMTHLLEELNTQKVVTIFGKSKDAVDIDAFLAGAFLRRVGLYPSKSGGYATLDYTIGTAETDYVLAVRFDDEGKVVGVEMES